MGFFSWKSCVSEDKTIYNTFTDWHRGISMILPNNLILRGDYDGYGRILDETYKKQYKKFHQEGVDIYVIAYLKGDIDAYFDLSESEHEEKRNEAIDLFFYGTTEPKNHHDYVSPPGLEIKVALKDEIKEHRNYDFYETSENAESQGYWLEPNDPDFHDYDEEECCPNCLEDEFDCECDED